LLLSYAKDSHKSPVRIISSITTNTRTYGVGPIEPAGLTS
jgi:hypothetical protein